VSIYRLCAVLLAFLPALRAQDITVQEIIREALVRNPEIKAAQKRVEAMRQKPYAEQALPDPMVSLGWNGSGYPYPGAGLGKEPTANIGLMVSQEIPYPGKRDLRAGVMKKEAEAEFQTALATQLRIVAQIKQAFFDWHHSVESADILRRNRDVLGQILQLTQARYTAGKAMQQDLFRLQTQLSLMEVKIQQFEREKTVKQAELNMLRAMPPEAKLGTPLLLMKHEVPVSLDSLYKAAEANAPILKRDQKLIERAEAAVNVARKDYYPDTTVNAGYYNMGSMPPMYMFRVDVKVPFWLRKQRAAVTEQVQKVAEARHMFEATDQSLHFRIKENFAMAETALNIIHLYENTILPQARLAIESGLTTYSTGGADFASVFMNYQSLVESELDYHEQMANFLMALSRLEELTGLELVAGGGK
jgi:outer membrane protein TolC